MIRAVRWLVIGIVMVPGLRRLLFFGSPATIDESGYAGQNRRGRL